ncbi:MAG: hypothetical protein WCU88_00890 [Elusimicrobiota bacterium]|jgi:hypothetical protein
MKIKNILILAAALACITAPSQAKWWIFGKANETVDVKYLYFNGVSSDEGDSQLTFFRSMLRNGSFQITGKAAAGKGAIGYVRVSLDGKKTWNDAKTADNGAFEYSFTPETGKSYEFFLEAADTAGKINEVDSTRRELRFSDEDPGSQVREALEALRDAYKAKDLKAFMARVGEDFAGDVVLLERAVQKDFVALQNIDLRWSVSNIASGREGRIHAALTFNRFVTLARTGATQTDSGSTEFVFEPGPKGLRVYSMKNPLLFGVSDPDNVGTGGTTGRGNLRLDDTGNPTNIESINNHNYVSLQSFGLTEGVVYEEPSMGVTQGDFGVPAAAGPITLKTGVQIQDLGVMSIQNVSAAPAGGYGTNAHANIGHCYAFKLISGKYAVIEIVSISMAGTDTRCTFKYRVF